eukprot:CAMPEP_0172595966 /NCGR_PEP_ID=MMETSP1068-20121228/15646_1 /TAXON_ID=35684 /ORGANISM="Pseudopedinella elastica, Strain CCMP716" /LENGTH=64 /DNA_ID=CAMNT_0013394761 /DNA_START=694 /DNA_END=888 /DNA_ORIENTATION=+
MRPKKTVVGGDSRSISLVMASQRRSETPRACNARGTSPVTAPRMIARGFCSSTGQPEAGSAGSQ